MRQLLPLLVLIFDLCALHSLIAVNVEKDDVRHDRCLVNQTIEFRAAVSAKVKTTVGYVKLSNINFFRLEVDREHGVFGAYVANCGFAEVPANTIPGGSPAYCMS